MRSAGWGLTLVEVLVALALFALVSLALSTSLLQLVKVDTRSRDAVKTSLTLQQTAEAIKAAWGNPLPAPVVQSGQSYAVTNYARNCVDALTLPPGVTATSQVLTLSLDPVALTDAVAPAGVPQPLLACTPAMLGVQASEVPALRRVKLRSVQGTDQSEITFDLADPARSGGQ